jgi:hypothetical protein
MGIQIYQRHELARNLSGETGRADCVKVVAPSQG